MTLITAAKETISGSNGTFPLLALERRLLPVLWKMQPNLSHETQVKNSILSISGT